jgi:hypothetical protein
MEGLMRKTTIAILALAGTALAATGTLTAQGAGDVESNPLRNAYFGDLHLHTGMSFDAAVASGVQLGPEASYRYAKGEEVDVLGRKVRRKAPLDFLAVTDHAEYLGMVLLAQDPDGPLASRGWVEKMSGTGMGGGGPGSQRGAVMGSGFYGNPKSVDDLRDYSLMRGVWNRVIDAAEDAYQPGKFTSFVGFEWSQTPGSAHYHRVAVFRGPTYPKLPFSAVDSRDVTDLWRYAEAHRKEGIDSLMIPHNSNLSDGMAFAFTDTAARPLDKAFVELSARNEPLVEITQVKGTSETHPDLSPTDEFANFELMNHYYYNNPTKLYRPVNGSYVRQALQRGLQLRKKFGIHPWRFGFVGASDFHLAVTGNEEFNYSGALGADNLEEPEALLHPTNVQSGGVLNAPLAQISASGLTGVWAEKNTRESLFDAMRRREVFATSGVRMKVRMFGGWDYANGMTRRDGWLRSAYDKGVPMGGNLSLERGGAKAPHFLFDAIKDPDSGNLDRIQVVKLWLEDGKPMEQVFEVTWSGDRKLDRNGKLPAVGNTVDLNTATYTNTIGAVRLTGEWSDPDFDPAVPAVYYARVLEIPTPRWTTYLAVQNGLPLSEVVPATLQERAWTSPIYYLPED